ncbi:hypothetical protein vseg_017946 [Gypsophila vaccaria]
MVNYKLMITAEMENVATLQPMNGLDDPHFTVYFKLRCELCGEVSEKDSCVSKDVEVTVPKSTHVANLVQKCKFCGREGNIKLVPVRRPWERDLTPLTAADCKAEKYKPLIGFECCGLEPFGTYFLGPQWKVQARSGTIFEDVDLTSGEWAEYDEKKNVPVTITNLKAKLEVLNRYPWS